MASPSYTAMMPPNWSAYVISACLSSWRRWSSPPRSVVSSRYLTINEMALNLLIAESGFETRFSPNAHCDYCNGAGRKSTSQIKIFWRILKTGRACSFVIHVLVPMPLDPAHVQVKEVDFHRCFFPGRAEPGARGLLVALFLLFVQAFAGRVPGARALHQPCTCTKRLRIRIDGLGPGRIIDK